MWTVETITALWESELNEPFIETDHTKTIRPGAKNAAEACQQETEDLGWQWLSLHDPRSTRATHLTHEFDVDTLLVCEWSRWDNLDAFLKHYRGGHLTEVRHRELKTVAWEMAVFAKTFESVLKDKAAREDGFKEQTATWSNEPRKDQTIPRERDEHPPMLGHYSKYDRRSILRITGGVIGAAVAGCIDTGQDADNEFVDDEPDYEGWFDGVDHYEGTLDWRGRQEARVMVGTGEGGVRFDPPAILIDHLTTVVWEWTGDGGDHNVIHEPESDSDAPMFESALTDEEGATFEFTFNHELIYTYYCEPHRDLGMQGAVAVEH